MLHFNPGTYVLDLPLFLFGNLIKNDLCGFVDFFKIGFRYAGREVVPLVNLSPSFHQSSCIIINSDSLLGSLLASDWKLSSIEPYFIFKY